MRISVDEARLLLAKGDVVAVPTETVYGLAASISKPEAIDKIFAIKGRPATNPLIIHVSSTDDLAEYVAAQPSGFEALATAFWPGALTLILPIIPSRVPAALRAGLPTAGVRIPSHPLALQLIRKTGPLVMPSANLSGRPSATSAAHVEADFGCDFPVLQGGCCEKGVESTILIFAQGSWRLIRLGALSPEDFLPVLGYVPEIDVGDRGAAPLCPGQSFRHYAPKAQLVLMKSIPADLPAPSQGVLLGFSDRTYPKGLELISMGLSSDPTTVAACLYDALRLLDVRNCAMAWVDMSFPQTGLWLTLEERLRRAAEGRS